MSALTHVDGPADAALTLVLAHGAGAPSDHPFMNAIAEGIAARGVRVVRFAFPYMAQRRVDSKQRPPDRLPVLQETFREVIAAQDGRVAIGGKSMGGRVASLIADEVGAEALVVLGYPFHPPGRPEKLRTEHLAGLRTPTLILQGERDPMGTRAEIADYALSDAIRVRYLPDGEHSFKPRKRSGFSEADNLAQAVEQAAGFLLGPRSA
ncbi:MAG: dienelactone hydrolase family protein [Alphaproteobacteria bacterium]|nr:dienelactone hydrolase family protein [Alphaproteobacteria bacterium]